VVGARLDQDVGEGVGHVAQTIRLLGPPAMERDGRPVRSPRGRKAWALLAYLLLADRPPSRRHLAELLFADADDPLGALRWTLA
jgi:DNA-binding SARP family transcriptional activator